MQLAAWRPAGGWQQLGLLVEDRSPSVQQMSVLGPDTFQKIT